MVDRVATEATSSCVLQQPQLDPAIPHQPLTQECYILSRPKDLNDSKVGIASVTYKAQL